MAGCWVRLGGQLGEGWGLEVGLFCWKGRGMVCCGFRKGNERDLGGECSGMEGSPRDAKVALKRSLLLLSFSGNWRRQRGRRRKVARVEEAEWILIH